MNFFIQLVIGGIMIGLTVMIHAIALDFIIKHAKIAEAVLRRLSKIFWRPLMASIIAVSVFALYRREAGEL
jgi:hypothetical protein